MNALQFAVVREDPLVELAILERCQQRRVLIVASGGCTALTLASNGARCMLVDPNPAQLAHVETKRRALAGPDRERVFGVGKDDPASLSGNGNFESLFRIFRAVLDDLVLPYADRRQALEAGGRAVLMEMTKNKFWPAAFAATFCDPLLEAMFGPAATQHAERGSYPSYFQRRIEATFTDVTKNYFMHHLLLGHWLATALPPFMLARAPAQPFESQQCMMQDVATFSGFDLISLSNIFDWMDTTAVRRVAGRITKEADAGAFVLVRQLNNTAPIERDFGDAFVFEQTTDRAAFYERVLIGRKR